MQRSSCVICQRYVFKSALKRKVSERDLGHVLIGALLSRRQRALVRQEKLPFNNMGDSPRSAAASPAGSDGSAGKKSNAIVSRQSGKVTFPNSMRSGANSQMSGLSDESEAKGNPFRMPPDNDIFLLRDKERQRKKQERIRQRKLKVHEKTTYATRINFKTASMIRPADSDDEGDKSDEDDGKAVAVKDDPQFTLSVTKDRHVEKESLADYIGKKREMFLVQYSLGVKRDEMRKLEEIAQAEERKLELAEQYLEEDAAMFDEFLKENDKNSVEAIKIAENETKAKLEKVTEIKKINAQMMAIKSEISKDEDTLKEYQLYKIFLEALTPKDWLDQRRSEKKKLHEEKRKAKDAAAKQRKDTATPTGSEKSNTAIDPKTRKKAGSRGLTSRSTSSLKKNSGPGEVESATDATDDESDSDEEPELYFTEPQQLLDIFAELEEQNLSLIQNSQETEEALEEMKQMIKQTKVKMEKETQVLKEQIDKLNNAINREEEKAKDLEVKARMFSFGEFKSEDQEKMLAALNKKVEDVYRCCIGDNEANIRTMFTPNVPDQKVLEKRASDLAYTYESNRLDSTLQMLTNIENRLEELFEQIEMMPVERVEAAEKAKDKERRLKMREEKMEQQRLHQEERVRRALERAKADPKKKTGRKLVGRSEPPQLKKREDDAADQASREEEELAYFFT